MEFWLLTSEFPPFYGGGIATYSFNIAQIQTKNFDRVRIFTPIIGKKDKFYLEGKIEIHGFSVSKWASIDLLGTDAALASGAKNYLDHVLSKSEKQIFMEVTDWGGIGYFILEAHHNLDEAFNFPIILSSHGPSTIMKKENAQKENTIKKILMEKLEFQSYVYADFVIFPSAYARKKIQDLIPNMEATKTSIIQYPIALPNSPHNAQSKSLDFLYFGRKQYLKGFDLFVSVVRGKDFKNKKIGVLGGDAWFHNFGKFGSELLKNSSVAYTDYGLVKPENVYASLKTAKVIVLPSRVEWYSYAYYEALLSGARIVISSGTGTQELAGFFDNLNTFIFENGNLEDLSKQMIHALESEDDLRHEMILNKTDDLNRNYQKSYIEIVNELKFSVKQPPQITDEIKVTIVIPHHNLTDYLADAIQSAQQEVSVRILVIDDGSTFNELVRCREICRKYNVELIETSNQGLAATRNLGLNTSETPYILFLDSDDQIEDQYLSECMRILDQISEVGLVGASIQLINESGKPAGVWRAWTPTLPLNYYINTINSAGMVWRKSVLRDIGGFNQVFQFGFEDWDAVNRALAIGAQVGIAPKAKFIYRIRKGSMFQRMDLAKKAEMYSLIEGGIENVYDQAVVELLLREHGPGYLQPNLWMPLAQDALSLATRIKNHFPFALKIWKFLPVGTKNWIFKRITSH